MAGIVEKIMGSLGFEVDPGEEKEFLETQAEEEQITNPANRRGKVVNINTTTRLNVVVIAPETFEDARDIADHLKAKKPCVVNLESVDKEISRRIIDFLSGAVYALDGSIQKISAGIFLIAPYNVSIMGDFKDELRSKGVFPWNY
ncbi:MAG: cell division protein SepF [Eubacteriales bacterium]|nr:cell division protein SepF [Eubacteriales bacterium]